MFVVALFLAALQLPSAAALRLERDALPKFASTPSSRRHALSSFASLALLSHPACRQAAFAEDVAVEATDLGANLLAFGPFGILSYGLKKRAAQQEACYDAGDCADSTMYYNIQCERGDTECLARKRQLARKEVNNFLDNPSSAPGVLVFAAFLFAGPLAAVVRTLVSLFSPPDDDDKPPPDEPPRSYGPGLPW